VPFQFSRAWSAHYLSTAEHKNILVAAAPRAEVYRNVLGITHVRSCCALHICEIGKQDAISCWRGAEGRLPVVSPRPRRCGWLVIAVVLQPQERAQKVERRHGGCTRDASNYRHSHFGVLRKQYSKIRVNELASLCKIFLQCSVFFAAGFLPHRRDSRPAVIIVVGIFLVFFFY
jgi:hypothetical protein